MKNKTIKQKLMKRFRTIWILELYNSVVFTLLTIYFNNIIGYKKCILLDYGVLVMVFILIQGAYYFIIKGKSLSGYKINHVNIAKKFDFFKRINLILIYVMPLVLILQLYLVEGSLSILIGSVQLYLLLQSM